MAAPTHAFSVKLQTKKGYFVLKDLNADTTLSTLRTEIIKVTGISETHLHVLVDYPPRPLDLSEDKKTLASAGIKGGEILRIEEKSNYALKATNSESSTTTKCTQSSVQDDETLARHLQAEEDSRVHNDQIVRESNRNGNFQGILLKRVVPADNSCLFTSVRFVINGIIDNEGSENMRRIIAQEVAADPVQYNDAVLGKPNAEYCLWIQKPESWGGAIELSILSNFYGIEIDVVDIQNAIINRFGEDRNYGVRVFLLFDGIHYDALYMEGEEGANPATMFPIDEMGIYRQAEQLAREAKSARQYTNVDKFTLRCMQCDARLVGQVQAQQHAKVTGHTRFGEI